MSRRSYTRLMHLPAWGLYDSDDKLVSTVRAESAAVAREIFKKHGKTGLVIRRITP